jgi:DNA-binding transcriptional MerR regulator
MIRLNGFQAYRGMRVMDTKLADGLGSRRAAVPLGKAGPDEDREHRSWPALRSMGFAYSEDAADGTIGALAQELGISVRTIRFYEDRGMLPPRRHAGARRYGPRERLHLKMILEGEALGFTLAEIRDILLAGAMDTEAGDCAAFDVSEVKRDAIGTRPRGTGAPEATTFDPGLALRPEQIVAQIAHLERQREALDAAIVVLREAHRRHVARGKRGALP